MFNSFTPAISPRALKAASQEVRRWRIHLWTGQDLAELARQINPTVAGWINYYGRFGRTELYPLHQPINTSLMRGAARKYKRLRAWNRLKRWWNRVLERAPRLFAHWALARTPLGYR